MIEGLNDNVMNLTGNRTMETETDKRSLLLDPNQKKKGSNRVKKNNGPTEIEMEAMQRWEKNDEEI